MDPNQALQNARKALAAWRKAESLSDPAVDAAEDMADALEALDAWLSNGGFLPAAWAR